MQTEGWKVLVLQGWPCSFYFWEPWLPPWELIWPSLAYGRLRDSVKQTWTFSAETFPRLFSQWPPRQVSGADLDHKTALGVAQPRRAPQRTLRTWRNPVVLILQTLWLTCYTSKANQYTDDVWCTLFLWIYLDTDLMLYVGRYSRYI